MRRREGLLKRCVGLLSQGTVARYASKADFEGALFFRRQELPGDLTGLLDRAAWRLLPGGGHRQPEDQIREADRRRWPIAQRRMRSDAVVGRSPETDHALRLLQRIANLLAQALVAQLAVEALAVPVRARGSRCDGLDLRPRLGDPLARGRCFCGTFSPARRQVPSSGGSRRMNPVLAHRPAACRQQRGDAAVAVAPVLGRQGDDGAGQRILVRQHVALRAPVLADDPAGVTFRGTVLPSDPVDRPPASLGGLHVSRGDVRQYLTHQRQVGHEPTQPSLFALQVLHRPRLVDLEAAVFLAPAGVALLGDLRLLACKGSTLALGCLHLDRSQLEHDLLRARLLTVPHGQLLRSRLILSISPVQARRSGQLLAELVFTSGSLCWALLVSSGQ